MAEIAAVVVLLASTSVIIGAGIAMGTRYIDRTILASGRDGDRGAPIVRPSHPSGSTWQADAT